VAGRTDPVRSTKTSDLGSSTTYSSIPFGATASWASLIPVIETPVAMVTAGPVIRACRESNGAAIRGPSGRA